MPANVSSQNDDLLRRLDQLPISVHERRVALAQARLAFRLVDALCDGFGVVRAAIAAFARGTPRARRAH